MDGVVAVSMAAPPVATVPSAIMESTDSTAPERPGNEEPISVTAMDTTEDASQPQTHTEPQTTAHVETNTADAPTQPAEAPVEATEATGAGETDPQESQRNPTQEEALSTPAPDTSLPPPPPPPVEEVEPATWADIEEDRSSPDEAELKEIESADGDYSAYECMADQETSLGRADR